MIIKLHDIEDEIEVRGKTDGSRFLRPEDTEIAFTAPIEWALKVRKIGRDVRLSGPVETVVRLACDRCLADVTFEVKGNLDIELAPKESQPLEADFELSPDDLNLYFFEGDEIDVDPYVYEEVIVNLPFKALCTDTCKGICPTCGTNLNAEQCRCETASATELSEKLRQFLKQN